MKTSRYALAILFTAGTLISAFWALHEQQQRLTALSACSAHPGNCYISAPTIANLMH